MLCLCLALTGCLTLSGCGGSGKARAGGDGSPAPSGTSATVSAVPTGSAMSSAVPTSDTAEVVDPSSDPGETDQTTSDTADVVDPSSDPGETDRTTAAALPVLGTPWAPSQQGYGTARPATVYNGGDSTGRVSKITWDDWGAAKAVGHGMGWLPNAKTGVVADGYFAPMTVVAFRLGTCKGRTAYLAVTWYAPSAGQAFDSGTYINACTGDYVGSQG